MIAPEELADLKQLLDEAMSVSWSGIPLAAKRLLNEVPALITAAERVGELERHVRAMEHDARTWAMQCANAENERDDLRATNTALVERVRELEALAQERFDQMHKWMDASYHAYPVFTHDHHS